MYVPLHLCPHMAAATTVGSRSLKVMVEAGALSPTGSGTSVGMLMLPRPRNLRHPCTSAGLTAACLLMKLVTSMLYSKADGALEAEEWQWGLSQRPMQKPWHIPLRRVCVHSWLRWFDRAFLLGSGLQRGSDGCVLDGLGIHNNGGAWCKRLEPRADKIVVPETRACILGCGERCGVLRGR